MSLSKSPITPFTDEGSKVKLRDYVLIKPNDTNGHGSTRPAQIVSIYVGNASHVYALVNYFYTLEDLKPEVVKGSRMPGRQPYHGWKEAIATDILQIVPAVAASAKTNIAYWSDDREEKPAHGGFFCRQALLDGKLTPLQLCHVCGQPRSLDGKLYQCENDSCKKLLHEGCLLRANIEQLRENGSFSKGSDRQFDVTFAARNGAGPSRGSLVLRCTAVWDDRIRCPLCLIAMESPPSGQLTTPESAERTLSQGLCCYDSVTFPNTCRRAKDPMLAACQKDFNRVRENQNRTSSQIIEQALHTTPEWTIKTAKLWAERSRLCETARERIVELDAIERQTHDPTPKPDSTSNSNNRRRGGTDCAGRALKPPESTTTARDAATARVAGKTPPISGGQKLPANPEHHAPRRLSSATQTSTPTQMRSMATSHTLATSTRSGTHPAERTEAKPSNQNPTKPNRQRLATGARDTEDDGGPPAASIRSEYFDAVGTEDSGCQGLEMNGEGNRLLRFPTVVRSRDGRWVELRCSECGANSTGNAGSARFFEGLQGLLKHWHRSHAVNGKVDTDYILDNCIYRGLNGATDFAQLSIPNSCAGDDHPWDHAARFPTIVMKPDGKWVELRCSSCKGNYAGSNYICGVLGFAEHLLTDHEERLFPTSDPSNDECLAVIREIKAGKYHRQSDRLMEKTVEKCFFQDVPEDDVNRITSLTFRSGEYSIEKIQVQYRREAKTQNSSVGPKAARSREGVAKGFAYVLYTEPQLRCSICSLPCRHQEELDLHKVTHPPEKQMPADMANDSSARSLRPRFQSSMSENRRGSYPSGEQRRADSPPPIPGRLPTTLTAGRKRGFDETTSSTASSNGDPAPPAKRPQVGRVAMGGNGTTTMADSIYFEIELTEPTDLSTSKEVDGSDLSCKTLVRRRSSSASSSASQARTACPSLTEAGINILSHLKGLYNASNDVVECIVSRLANDREWKSKRDAFDGHYKRFGTRECIALRDIKKVLYRPNPPSESPSLQRLEELVQNANLAQFLTQLIYLTPEELDEAWVDFCRLGRAFPGHLVSGFVQPGVGVADASTFAGKSTMLDETAKFGIEFRTQLTIMYLRKQASSAGFDPTDRLLDIWNMRGSKTDPPPIRGWETPGLQSEGGVVSGRHLGIVEERLRQIKTHISGNRVNFDELRKEFPWAGFINTALGWSHQRNAKIRGAIQTQGGLDQILSNLEKEIGIGGVCTRSLPQQGLPPTEIARG